MSKNVLGQRIIAVGACAMMASSNQPGTKKPAIRLADAIDVESSAGELAALAFEHVSQRGDVRERWAAAAVALSSGWTPPGVSAALRKAIDG